MVIARREPVERRTRERVLEAALSEFAERGFHDASIEGIAERAGLTKGAVYYYFHDKDDLAADLQAELWERLAAEANEGFEPDEPIGDNLKRSLRTFLAALDDLGEARFFLRDCWAIPTLDIAGRAEHESGVTLVRALLEEGMERGEFRVTDPEAAARVLLGAFAEAALHILTTGDLEPTIEVVERMVDALVAGERAGSDRVEVGDRRW